ncbi:hypothetical protein [Microbacterium sp. NPDC055599]
MTDTTTTLLAIELGQLLDRIAGDWHVARTEAADKHRSRAGFSKVGDTCEAWVTSEDHRERVVLTPSESFHISTDDLRFFKRLAAVFDHDLQVVGSSRRAQEVWSELSDTRFLRAASRISPFATTPLLRWVRAFGAAARQTYEGVPFAGSLVMVKNLESFRTAVGDRYNAFEQPMDFERALLNEKWLRPFLQNGDFALVTVGHSGRVRGFTDAKQPWSHSVELAPTAELEGLYGHLRAGTSVLSASVSGDIHLALPSGVTFVNTQGRWRYQNWMRLEAIVARHSDDSVAQHVVRLVRSASFSHQGALFLVLGPDINVSQVIPDHRDAERSSKALRATLTGIALDDHLTSRLLRIASRIDGAIVLSSTGQVLDVASMVTEPTASTLAESGLAHLQRFPGARTTAAWNGSVAGLAIKVSDDGPVDAFERGRLVFHAG